MQKGSSERGAQPPWCTTGYRTMDYDRSDTSAGTDDDLPPMQPVGTFRGRVAGNGGAYDGRAAAEQQLRKLEKDAYIAVLQAFSAQSEVITWAKEQLMSSLRKELRISEEQHLGFVRGIESNGTLRQIRERRMLGDEHMGALYAASNLGPSPNVAPRKRQKTTHVSQVALPPPTIKAGIPSPPLAPVAPSKRPPPRGKKSKGGRHQINASKKPHSQGLPLGPNASQSINPWVGAKVKTRWPEDNEFYEAVITDYNPETGAHALVYEMNTENETWEWVKLDELSPSDLKIVSGAPKIMTGKSTAATGAAAAWATAGRGMNKEGEKSGLGGKGRSTNVTSSGLHLQNGPNMKGWNPFQLPPIDLLVKEVDKIAEEDDLGKIECVKRKAKEYEEMLRKALDEIGESSEEDGESEEEEHAPFLQHPMDFERERRSRQDSRQQHGDDDEDDTAGNREGSV